MKKSELFFNVLLVPVDFLMIILAGLATYFFRTEILAYFRPVLFEFNLPLEKYFFLVFFVAILFVVVFAASGLYKMKTIRNWAEEFSKVVIASSASIMILIIFIFLRQELFNSRFLILGGWFLAIVFVSLGRVLTRKLQRRLVTFYDFGIHRVMVIGEDFISERFVQEIKNNPSAGYRIVKQLANPEVSEVKMSISNPGVDEVILANPNYPAEEILQIIDFCNDNHITFKFVPNIYQALTTNFSVDVFSGVPVIELKRTNLDGWGRVIKRVTDIFSSLIALVVLSPLFLIVAFTIKWETEGPVFVKLRRVSQNREFNLLKFRSMIRNAEELKQRVSHLNERKDGPLFKIKDDPRVTGVGRFIRKHSLDEVPQFINILKGEMSLVGPRPHEPEEVGHYTPNQKRLLTIKPGVTGLAQISGRSDLDFAEEERLDIFYIEKRAKRNLFN